MARDVEGVTNHRRSVHVRIHFSVCPRLTSILGGINKVDSARGNKDAVRGNKSVAHRYDRIAKIPLNTVG
jgi:hypothetical protein